MNGSAKPVHNFIHHFWYREKNNRKKENQILEMLANAQRDGDPAEYIRRPLFSAAKFG